jgi:tRNA threonylcarbamoyladenosine biosynthesis protein TsaE
MNTQEFQKFLPDEEATLTFGAKLAGACHTEAAAIFLYGDLGAGKTTLVRGFMQGLGYVGKVKSPTYTLVEPYEVGAQKIFHFDLYRIQDPHELEYIGLGDYFSLDALCLVEWPQNGLQALPIADVSCYIMSYSTGRQIRLEALTPHGQKILERLDRHKPHAI